MSNSLSGKKIEDVDKFFAGVTQFIDNVIAPKKILLAGSARRGKQTPVDIDIVVVMPEHEDYDLTYAAMRNILTSHRDNFAERLTEKGIENFKSGLGSHFLFDGSQVDLFFSIPSSEAACYLFWTGSRHHNMKMLIHANRLNHLFSPFGLWTKCKNGELGVLNKEFNSELELVKFLDGVIDPSRR